MPLIRQEEIYPAAQYPWAQAIEMVAGAGGVARHDLVVVTANSAAASVIPDAVKADANGSSVHAGIIMVAAGEAEANAKFLAVPWVVITGVDTSSATAGNPVYLSETAGGFTKTKPTAAGSVVVPVGTILEVDATDGVVMLKPGGAALEGFRKVGTVTVANGGTTSPTVALGANFAGGRAVATINEATSNATTVNYVTIDGSGNLVVELSADPGASNADVTYVAYSGAL